MLGTEINSEKNGNEVAGQLSRINEQLAIRNRRSHRIWTTIAIILIAFVLFNILLFVVNMVAYNSYATTSELSITVEEVEEDLILEEE